jgi:hypothetical protein
MPSHRRRHPLEGPEPDQHRRFYPYGFAVDVFTNSSTVHEILARLWGCFPERFEQRAIRCEILVTPTEDTECPPEPRYHMNMPYLTTTCDGDNFSIVDLERGTVYTQLTTAALAHPLFAGYFLLSCAISCICSNYVTPVHAACVSWKGRGILLCGDSGAGKSTLAYSCALDGWTYTTDDATFLLHQEYGQLVIGNCYQVRLRPESAAVFPEVTGLEITPRAAGKPSIELRTCSRPEIATSSVAEIYTIVQLNRNHDGPASFVPYLKEKARESMVGSLYGTADTLRLQYHAIDRLLSVPMVELRYKTLEEGRRLLRQLAERDLHAGH